VRITHVVTEKTTNRMIEQFLKFQDEIKCEFTIKELVGYSDKNRYKDLKIDFPEIYSLDKGDYNIYYMPDNSVSNNFLI